MNAFSAVDPLHAEELQAGWSREFGPLRLSEAEIIAFAEMVDPQPLHTDPEAAQQSVFKGLIASGLHPYAAFHKRYWVDLVRDTFICGLGLGGVHFEQPVRPDQPLLARWEIRRTEPKPQKGTQVVHWQLHIHDAKSGERLQTVEYSSYHWLPRAAGGGNLA